MEFNFNMRGRRSIRLKGHDYSAPGDYFVTICTMNMECVFGEVLDGKMKLSSAGEIVSLEWQITPRIRPIIELGPFVIMPNHLHGIITIHPRRGDPQHKSSAPADMICLQTKLPGRPECVRPAFLADSIPIDSRLQSQGPPTLEPGTIGAIIGQFKSLSTKKSARPNWWDFIGSGIIMNISSAISPNWSKSEIISLAIPCIGSMTRIIREIYNSLSGERVYFYELPFKALKKD